MNNNDRDHDKIWKEGTTPMQKEMCELIEKEFGKDAWNPCYGDFTIKNIEKACMLGLESAKAEIARITRILDIEIFKVKQHEYIEKLREENGELLLKSGCLKSMYNELNEEIEKLREELKKNYREQGRYIDQIERELKTERTCASEILKIAGNDQDNNHTVKFVKLARATIAKREIYI